MKQFILLSLVILLVTFTSCNYLTNFRTGEQKQTFFLRDGTHLTLNQFSKVKYKKRFEERKIKVEGEVYIELAYDEQERPFYIECEQLLLKLYGDEFYIKSNDEKVILIPIDGRARAEVFGIGGQNIVTIKENNQLEFDLSESIIQVSDVEDQNFMSWYHDALFYANLPLKKVMNNLEQHFDIQLKVSTYALENCIINDTFPTPNINLILPKLANQANCKIEKTERSYVFVGEGCEVVEFY